MNLYNDIVEMLNINYDQINKGMFLKLMESYQKMKKYLLFGKNKWKTELTEDEIKNKKIK